MRDLGYEIPPFDLSLKGVSSIMTDGHKLGLLPIATGLLPGPRREPVRVDPDRADADPHDVVDEAGLAGRRRLGDVPEPRPRGLSPVHRPRAQAARHHRGRRDGDPRHVASRRPASSASIGFTSKTINLEDVHDQMADDGWGQGYGTIRGKPFIRLSIHPSRDEEQPTGS